MARGIENTAQRILTALCGARMPTPKWLQRPGTSECGSRWPLVQEIYHALTGSTLPDTMPPRERRIVDGVFCAPSGQSFIFELDEKQHFNRFRAVTLRLYPHSMPLAFSRDQWIQRSLRKKRLVGGGFGKPKPPLFPGENGRHQQRAFGDALTDILPLKFGFEPTLRLADFELRDWIFLADSEDRMEALLADRLGRSIHFQ